MLNQLINYITPMESEDRILFLRHLDAMFFDYQHSAMEVEISLMLDDCRSARETATQIWDRAYVIIERNMNEMLVGMGLNVLDATVQFKLELLNACKTIEVTDMHEFIYDTAVNDAVPLSERFETLMEFAMGRQVPELFDFVEDCPLSLMNRIFQIHKPYIENTAFTDLNAPVDYSKEIARIKNFFAYCKSKNLNLRVHDLISAGVKPLMRTEFLLGNNMDMLKELEPEAPDHAAAELVGLLLLCDIDFSNINAAVGNYAELYFVDTAFISRLSGQATEIISSANITGDVSATEDIQWTNSNTLDWL